MFDRANATKERLDQGVTVEELAAAAHVTSRQMFRYLAGESQPPYSVGLRIEKRLGLLPGGLYIHEGEADTASEPRGEVAPTHTKAPTDAAERLTVGAFAQGD